MFLTIITAQFFICIGAGVFVTTVVAGTIAIIQPFDAMQRPFLRDVIFFLAATFWAFQILWKKEITKFEAIGKEYYLESSELLNLSN